MRILDKENRVDALNALRVIATLSVFFLHTTIFEPDIGELFASGGLSFLWRTPAWSGVWIFFVLGGYFAGKGFASGRYSFSRKSILNYYLKKIKRIYIPTFCFLFLCAVLCFPDFFVANKGVLIKFFTFTYPGTPGVNGVGATWYVFTLFWLYLATPPIAYLLSKIRDNKTIMWIMIAVLSVVNILWRRYALHAQLDWFSRVYVPSIANLDLYVGGVVFAYINTPPPNGEKGESPPDTARIVRKVFAVFLTMIAFISNCYFYNQLSLGSQIGASLPGYYYQTIWLAVCIVYIGAYDYPRVQNTQLSKSAILKNPLRIIDAFASIGFEFYLFHSLVLDRIAPYVLAGKEMSWFLHIELLFVSGLITLILSIGFHSIFNSKR